MNQVGLSNMLSRMAVVATIALGLPLAQRPALAASASCPAVGAAAPPAEAVPGPINEPGWQKRLGDLDTQIATEDLTRVHMLFLGDSITEAWAPILFTHFYGERAALNLGVRSDTTQGLLWRLQRLPLGTTLKPELIVLLIGTNDLWPGVNPSNVATGIGEVVHQIRTRSPQSRILLLGLLPRGESPGDPMRPLRVMINAVLAQCADQWVTFADPGALLLDSNGRLTKDFAYDFLHPSWLGYAILGAALEPDVRRLLGE